MAHCAVGFCSSPVHCKEIGRCFSARNDVPKPVAPIDMVLHCPKCGVQHIDGIETPNFDDEDGKVWMNPPHRSHLCHGCGHIWRPADVPTNGVEAVKTKGKDDSPIFEGVDCETEAQGYAIEAIWQFLPELRCRDDGLTVLTPAQLETVLRRCGWIPPSDPRNRVKLSFVPEVDYGVAPQGADSEKP